MCSLHNYVSVYITHTVIDIATSDKDDGLVASLIVAVVGPLPAVVSE